ncbi:MAG: carbohydrate binding family 9 domain-containing protein [Pyrinomonadaceae bacterium]
MKKLFALILSLFFTIFIQAQTQNTLTDGKFNLPPEKKEPVVVARFSTPPVIDGKLDDEVWKTAPVLKDFYQTSPGDNVAPSKPTEVMLGYDEKNLYIAFKCYDERDKIRATVAKRDEVFGEDNVRVWLDTFNDHRRAYILGFNPLGIQQDGIYTEGQGADYSVDIVMESKGVIEDWGWSVEVKIPFKSLRYAAGRGKLWGFNVARNIDRFNDELDSWMPDDKNISGFLIKHGKITGLESIKTERTLEVVPSVTLSESGTRRRTIFQSVVNNLPPGAVIDPGRFANDGISQDIGVNFKLNVTPNVTLDAAYNPDYAEIEADAPVVTANQRFPIFFQEKRPFFLEGADIFQSPLQVFYSRQIIDPDFAVKLTGKSGRNTFGILAASDNAPGNYSKEDRDDPGLRPSGEFLDKNANFVVARLKRDIGKENNIGFFGTMRVFPRQHNFTGGFDGKFKLDSKTTMVFQTVATHSRANFYNPETDSAPYRTGNGFGYYFNLDHTAKNNGWTIKAEGRSPLYRADAGFTPRVNTNSIFAANRLSSDSKPKSKLIRVDWQQFARLKYDWKGRSQEGLLGTGFDLQLKGNLFIHSETGIGYERLFEEEFGAKRGAAQTGAFFGAPERSAYQPYVSVNVNKTVNKQISLYGFVGTIWSAFDYDFGSGFRYPRISPAYNAYLQSPNYLDYLTLRDLNPRDPDNFPPNTPPIDPGEGRQLDLQFGGTYKPIDPLRVSLDYTKSKLTRYDTGKVAFDANIVTARSTYQFTRFIFARARIDYNSLNSNVSGQALFGWNPNPGTAVYVGYNDSFNYNGFNPYTGQYEPNIVQNGRTFFIRMSYLFRRSF